MTVPLFRKRTRAQKRGSLSTDIPGLDSLNPSEPVWTWPLLPRNPETRKLTLGARITQIPESFKFLARFVPLVCLGHQYQLCLLRRYPPNLFAPPLSLVIDSLVSSSSFQATKQTWILLCSGYWVASYLLTWTAICPIYNRASIDLYYHNISRYCPLARACWIRLNT
jgi:hypothetical protein